ncbi:LacI family DNA-binding transcriptional regulator [Vibrio sp. 10N.222.51.C12]|uniref:LacI family DNA-binding transcriptional regulator n=1 Tax=unclassified Vibrio TaxID=2614977 RepID=UPI000C8322E9|nr:LacI family DNA-binding transcriptional regulator [Vibrio sp. 10N.286.48.B7]PMH80605.1 transcriptional regulator [Vibrio sp. 10N.286.48.B7]
MASLHDVAKLAGVSKSTVSRVVNDEYGVKESTKIKVKKAIEECGYFVNQVAKDLKLQRTNLIGVIVPTVSSGAVSQGVDGLSQVFEQAGKYVLLANSQHNNDKEVEFIRLFNQKRVEGIILYATHLDKELVKVITQSDVPVVLVGQDGSLFDIPSVIHDDSRVGFVAGQRLVDSGAKKIGFIGVASQDIAVDSMRYQGLLQATQFAGLGEPLFHSRGEFSIDSGYEQMLSILNTHPTVDGVFCATDRIALGAMNALKQAGKVPGKDVKVLGVGDDELSSICTPSLSTFHYSFDSAGESSAQVLLDLIDGKQQHMSKMVLGFKSVDRETC